MGHDRSSSLENRLKQVEAEREPGERSPGEACSQRSCIQVNEDLLLCVFKDSALKEQCIVETIWMVDVTEPS